MSYPVIIIGVLIVSLLLFFLLRELNCWYWKINERIALTQRQNLLLEKILQHFTGEITLNESIINEESSTIDKGDVYNNLSEPEKIEADKFIKYGLKDGDRLVINKKTRNIDRFSEKEWEEIVKNYLQNEWLIISSKL